MPREDVTVTVEPTADEQAKLYAETDARFAAQTGITRKLDPKSALDAKWIPVWHDLYGKVFAQWKVGTLAYTYDHPSITGALIDAGKLAGDAMGKLTTAIAAKPDGIAGALALPEAIASSDAARRAGEAQAKVDAAVRATQTIAAGDRGVRHGVLTGPPAPPPAVVDPHLVQHAAGEIADDMRRWTRGVDSAIGSVADAIMAMQARVAPAIAAGVNQIANAPAPVVQSAPPPPGPGAPVVHERGQRHEAGWVVQHAGELGIGAMVAAGVGLVAIAASGGGRRSAPRRRRARYA